MRAIRDNRAKIPMSQIPVGPLSDVARVFQYGSIKYGTMRGWRDGVTVHEAIDAALRHIYAFLSGENLDPESGLPHLSHGVWNLMTLAECLRLHPEIDDRVEQAEWEPGGPVRMSTSVAALDGTLKP